jgi:prolipoprotein diacylglyceryltransferase
MDEMQLFTPYFLIRLLINTVAMIILVRIIYYNTYKKKDSFFTFFLFNFIVFLLAYMLEKTKAFNSLGSAFGLLAAFSLMRFRTEAITTKDMTYLFIIMTFGLLNSVMKGTYLEIIGLNAMIIGAVYIVDGNQIMRNQKFKTIEYPSLENIKPERHAQLIAELRGRTGLEIEKISIEHIDFGKEKALIKVYYY